MNRLKYIDALRGLAILMVVIVHIEGFGLYAEQAFDVSILWHICEAIMLPLFFFISGFCFKIQSTKELIKCCIRLIVPAIILGIIHSLIFEKEILSFFCNVYKWGYWFTITLCGMFVILHYIVKISKNQSSLIWTLILISCFLYILKVPFNSYIILTKIGNIFCLHQLFVYFHYFAVGHIFARNKEFYHKTLNNEFITIVSIFVFFLALYIKHTYTDDELTTTIPLKIYRAIQQPILGYSSLALIVRFLYQSDYLLSKNVFGKLICYIGTHTLEIYLLHYFFIPKLSSVGTYLTNYPNIIIELLICLILSTLVIGFSLLLGRVIRTNEILSFFLIGTKLPIKKTTIEQTINAK